MAKSEVGGCRGFGKILVPVPYGCEVSETVRVSVVSVEVFCESPDPGRVSGRVVPVGEETRGECSRERLRVVRADRWAAHTTMPSMNTALGCTQAPSLRPVQRHTHPFEQCLNGLTPEMHAYGGKSAVSNRMGCNT